MNIGRLNVTVESEVEALMREHKELLNRITEIENTLAGMVTDKVTTSYGTAEWKSSVRYDNSAIVQHLEDNGTLTQDVKNMFIRYDETGIVNYFNLGKSDKEPFKIRGERKLSISHRKL